MLLVTLTLTGAYRMLTCDTDTDRCLQCSDATMSLWLQSQKSQILSVKAVSAFQTDLTADIRKSEVEEACLCQIFLGLV